MSDAAVHQLTPGYNFNGRYCVSRCIGAGGMGSVYEAVHNETHGRVALKVMLPRLVHREDMRRRFMQEAQVTAKIASDHIVQVFDAGVDESTGMPFIVMELLDGEDLDAFLARAGRLEPSAVIALLSQAALALDKTHAAGVVHRDLKPHNLFISKRDDGSPCMKILDFGIAKLIDATGGSERTRSAGTPVYMPPEQVRGEGDIDAAADGYALAHIAYTMLVGRPYWETEAIELGLGPFIERVFAGPSESPTSRAARSGVQLPAGFDAWFARAAGAAKEWRILPASQAIAALAAVFGLSSGSVRSIHLPSVPSAPPLTATAAGTPVGFTSSGAGGLHPPVQFSHGSATTGAVVAEAPPHHPAKARTKPLWFLVGATVVLASVAVGSLITYRLVLSDRGERVERDSDDEDGDTSSKKKKKKEAQPCPFERCKDIKFDKKKPVEALHWMKKANKMARSLDRKAELVMISIGETANGKTLADSSFSMIFMYRYPRPAGEPGEYSGLQVMLNDKQLMARRAQHVGIAPVSPPACGTQKALKAAFADGLDRKKRSSMVYQMSPIGSAPQWMVVQTGQTTNMRYVDGISCAVTNPF